MARIEWVKYFKYDPVTGILSNLLKGRGAGTCYVNNFGYLTVKVKGNSIPSHRLAWFLYYKKWPQYHIDHINGIKTDNRIFNLRDVVNKENCKNQKLAKNNTTGFLGVSWQQSRKKYQATVCVDGKDIHLGRYVEFEEAIKVRMKANIKYGFHPNHGRRVAISPA